MGVECMCNLTISEISEEMLENSPQLDLDCQLITILCKIDHKRTQLSALATMIHLSDSEIMAAQLAREAAVIIACTHAQSDDDDLKARGKAALENFAEAGFTMQNIAKHNIKPEIWKGLTQNK